ncbi:MAG: S41 family peptidase [Planctomycetota bacterium]
MPRITLSACPVVLVVFVRGGCAQEEAPAVVRCEPAHLAVDVDAATTKELVVTFDRPMDTRGWSVCGGGPAFPKIKGRPRYETPRKLVIEVELEPDHDYAMSLNCGAAKNFRSKEGTPLLPVPWTFSTAPRDLPDPRVQTKANRDALAELRDLLPRAYSYYDLRVADWPGLWSKHEAAILGAKTTRGFASAVASVLAATEDIHLHLRLGDQVFAAGRRAIDPLYRSRLVGKYFDTKPAGDNALVGRNDEGIGYLMVATWGSRKDADAVEATLPQLRDCKAIVVDVRPNAGGDEALARRVAEWFVDGTKTYAKNRYRIAAGRDGFGPVLDRQITGNTDADEQIRCPIAVLTSRYVMSSNESFVMMLQQAPDCTVVGQPTYGSSGNPRPHELTNGVVVVLPSWQDLRLDGTCLEGEGIAPDVPVEVDARDDRDRDPILERALDVLRGKLGK